MTSNIFYNYSKISSALHNPDVLIFLYSPRILGLSIFMLAFVTKNICYKTELCAQQIIQSQFENSKFHSSNLRW